MSKFEKFLNKLRKHQVENRGQTMSEYSVNLMIISSATVLLFSPGLSNGIGKTVTEVARLLP